MSDDRAPNVTDAMRMPAKDAEITRLRAELAEAEARGYRRGIEAAVTAVAPSPAPAERRDDGYLSWDEVTPIAYWISINGAPEVRDVSAWNAFFGGALSEKK